MHMTDTVIIGAGQAGLATSWYLTDRGREHVVLERGRVAERWRSERWDSLRTLTPNWLTRLPGAPYAGSDPDGFMATAELVARFDAYATSFAAPAIEHTTVHGVTHDGGAFEVLAGPSRWRARNVVIATGWADRPHIPSFARGLPSRVQQVVPSRYRNPDQIAGSRVLVVGASSSGAQIASELAAAGRDVTLAVGCHRRLPRRYRGRDITWWLDRSGGLDRLPVDHAEHDRLLREPSLQLVADRDLDLGTLAAQGVATTGRVTDVDRSAVSFADDLAATVAEADARLARLVRRIDGVADHLGVGAPQTVAPIRLASGPRSLSTGRGGVDAVVWATGFQRKYPWLHVPVVDAAGDIRHQRGITAVPGLYVVGMRLQSGRRSTWIDGARVDAAFVADAIEARAPQRSAA
jgi:putative flavoprotein involved in K+ transport